MLMRRQEQKIHVEKELLELLAPTLFKRTILTRTEEARKKTTQTTTFKKKKKKKKKGAYYVCESPDHFAAKCPNRKGGKKSTNMVISESGGTSR
jgi:hypothetical protein